MSDSLLTVASQLAQQNPPDPDLAEQAVANSPSICFDQLLNSLVEKQWFVAENYLPAALCERLAAELKQLNAAQRLSPAGIGRGTEHHQAEQIRSDFTHWLNGDTPVQREFLSIMRELKDTLNRELFLGLFEYECHYAFYPPGSFYQKHYDAFRGRSNRVVTTVLYLNPNWEAAHEGQMRVYHPETGAALLDVPPRSGTLVCFLSEKVAHEVLPTQADRLSIAGWFRINNSLQGLVDPPR